MFIKKIHVSKGLLICCGFTLIVCAVVATSCSRSAEVRPGTRVPRHGDEIIVAGQMFRTGTPVVLWMDPGGYDAYRVERRFSPIEESNWSNSVRAVRELRTPNRFDTRRGRLTESQRERVRGGGWDLELLRQIVDQFVIHYDVEGTAQRCFYTLHDRRGLSVHFLLDLDGTIYQTLDLKERAWHTRASNDRSIGIEIANLGAYGEDEADPFDQWYFSDPDGGIHISIPTHLGNGGIRTENFVGRPAQNGLIEGEIHDRILRQFDFTREQYEALILLAASLSEIFPNLKLEYPTDSEGGLITTQLSAEEIERHQGLIGHFHLQKNKVDPGPAFSWEFVVRRARALLEEKSVH